MNTKGGEMSDTIKRPLIGITTGVIPDLEEPWKPHQLGQRHDYMDAVIASGGVPVLLPLSADPEVIERLVDALDGFLLAGGDDIDPVHYGEENLHSIKIDLERDAFEMRLLEQIERAGKPVLAICRGMQMLNVARGGTLYQDISAQLTDAEDHKHSDHIKNPAAIAHQIEVVPGSMLGRLLDVDSLRANSRHHQAIRQLGEGLVVSARAGDLIVEAVEDPEREFVVGIQCHPESLRGSVETTWTRLFNRFIEVSVQERPSVVLLPDISSDDPAVEQEVPVFAA